MTPHGVAEFLQLVSARRGHFLLESGYHGRLWLVLDPLFTEHQRLAPFVDALASAIEKYNVDAVCGPLRGGAFLAQLLAARLDAEFFFTERIDATLGSRLFSAQYRLPHGFASRVHGRRVAIVDDVMSTGSSLRATYEALKARDAEPVVAGALLTLGSRGREFFEAQQVPVEAVAREGYETWAPSECPLCAGQIPLENMSY